MKCAALVAASSTAGRTGDELAQVHYHPDGRPWNLATRRGPDAQVPGWY